ncbi:MAG: carboxypeptidase-like regulatory domain-containing protein [Gemmatimonadaceae bacterium]|nr:carboxypeptidase-like regulatory domain-containing protein [Gemmatimonadaceae bacterium]
MRSVIHGTLSIAKYSKSCAHLRSPAVARCASWARSVAVASGLLIGAANLQGQAAYAVHGRVMAPDSAPIFGVHVVAIGTSARASTSPRGTFRFLVAAGRWPVALRRLGFQPDTITIEVPRDTATELLIILRPAATPLPVMKVAGEGGRAFSSIAPGETVKRLPSLAEPDVFRAIALLPGVSTPNDLKGTIHLAGGAGDETGVTLDGHPLAEPFHLAGLLGAFNVEALEDASIHLGVLPMEYSGRLGGLIQLNSRQTHGVSEGQARVGLLSGGLTLLRSPASGRSDLLFSVRSSYLDKIAERIVRRTSGSELLLPGYRDGLLRVGANWRPGSRTELLAFATGDTRRMISDERGADTPGLHTREQLFGIRHSQTTRSYTIKGRIAVNRSLASLSGELYDFSPQVDNAQDWLSGAVSLDYRATFGVISAGLNTDRRTTRLRWSNIVSTTFARSDPARYQGSQSQSQLGAFLQWSTASTTTLRPTAGMRITSVGSATHVAPRVSLVVANLASLEWRAALERRDQFESELGTSIEGSLPQPRFFLDAPRKVDVASIQATWKTKASPERALHVTAIVEAFARRYRNRTALVDSATAVAAGLTPAFPSFLRVDGMGRGASIAGVATFHRSSLQLSYTYNDVWEVRDGQRSPPDWAIRQNLAATASTSLGRAWYLTTVLQAHDGQVTTPVAAHLFGTPNSVDLRGGTLPPRYLYGPRNSGRLAPYARVDLGARREWHSRRATWSFSITTLNVMNRRNPLEYDWFSFFCARAGDCAYAQSRSGLPFLPSISVDVRW